MIPEIGHYALILALCVAVVQGTLPSYGAEVGNSSLMSVAKPAARIRCSFARMPASARPNLDRVSSVRHFKTIARATSAV